MDLRLIMNPEIISKPLKLAHAAWRLSLCMLVLAMMFLAGAYTAVDRKWSQPLVTVHVKNNQGVHVKNIRLIYQSARADGVIDAGPIGPGKADAIVFSLQGEGSYTLEALLVDGRVLKGAAGYVESGHHVEHEITRSGIRSVT